MELAISELLISYGLAQAGAKVYVLGRNNEKLATLAKRNSDFPQPRLFVRELDILNENDFSLFVEEVIHQDGQVSCLVNNANSAGREKWEQLNKQSFLEGFEGLTQSLLYVYSSCFRAYDPTEKGNIINNASLFSFLAPNFPMHLDLNNAAAAHHVAAKGGILQMTRYLSTLWAPLGIRVNAVSPGYFPQKEVQNV
ncbi:MAG: SDR family oxidoreductase [Bdellovibrionales bacterium]|nr:SDR family oxidoreductase [Bdellovibrionales bacterium]